MTWSFQMSGQDGWILMALLFLFLGQTLRFYCRDCDTAVCSSCTDIEHGRHLTIRVLDAVLDEKVRLKELMETVQGKVCKVELNRELRKIT